MTERTLQGIEGYRRYLIDQERSNATIDKYVRDVKKFYFFLPEDKVADNEKTEKISNDRLSLIIETIFKNVLK